MIMQTKPPYREFETVDLRLSALPLTIFPDIKYCLSKILVNVKFQLNLGSIFEQNNFIHKFKLRHFETNKFISNFFS